MTPLQTLLCNIERHISLDKQRQKIIESLFLVKTVERGQTIIRQGESCKSLFYISTGVLRSFFISSAGKESTIMLANADWWITDMDAFLNQNIASVSVQAVNRSTVLEINKSSWDSLYETIPYFDRFFRILMEKAYCREQSRVLSNLSLTAEERYEAFIQKYPDFVRVVPQKHIASYLGMTPEFLSNIRGRQFRRLS